MTNRTPFGGRLSAALAVVVLGAGLTADYAAAQAPGDWQGMLNRINRLQEQIYDLRDGTGQAAGAQASGDVSIRITNLEQQVQMLAEQVQRLAFQIEQMSADLNNAQAGGPSSVGAVPQEGSGALRLDGAASGELGSVETAPPPRILGTIPGTAQDGGQALVQPNGGQQGEQSASLVPESVTSQPLDSVAGGGGGATASAGAVEQLYQQSHEQYLRRQFDTAEAGFKRLLREHPKHELAGNARYWLGETYYARGQFRNAAEAFLSGYKADKTGPKAPDSLVKLGMTLDRLGQKKQACAALAQAAKEFPDAPAHKVAEQERKRAGC